MKTTIKPLLLKRNERLIIAVFLLLVAILAFWDLYNDYFDGVVFWHLLIEMLVAFSSLIGVYFLIRDRFILRRTLRKEQQLSKELQQEALKWKRVSKTYLEGLSVVIDEQLTNWGLTNAEKEVAFLILKGFSDQKIAGIRNTSVKTVRTQTIAIYSKSGLSGRSELTAFFLEDLLPPQANEPS